MQLMSTKKIARLRGRFHCQVAKKRNKELPSKLSTTLPVSMTSRLNKPGFITWLKKKTNPTTPVNNMSPSQRCQLINPQMTPAFTRRFKSQSKRVFCGKGSFLIGSFLHAQ